MQNLIEVLKYSSAFDFMIIGFAFILIVAGLLLLIISSSRKAFYLLLLIALLPLLLGMLSTFMKYREIDRMMAQVGGSLTEVAASARQEAWIITYIGAAGTAVLAAIGLTGLVLKKR